MAIEFRAEHNGYYGGWHNLIDTEPDNLTWKLLASATTQEPDDNEIVDIDPDTTIFDM